MHWSRDSCMDCEPRLAGQPKEDQPRTNEDGSEWKVKGLDGP